MQSSVLQRGSKPTEAGGVSVAARISSQAASEPGRPAIFDGDFFLTFGELDHLSDQLATYLWESGAGPESCIGLLMDRSPQFVIAALAVLKTGAAYLPIDAQTPADRVAFILGDADAKMVLTHRQKTRGMNLGNCRIVELEGADAPRIAARPATPARVEPEASSLAYVIYTSGSTGRPKGVEITHGNLLNLIDWHNSTFGLTPADRASQVAGLGFDAAVWEIWPALAAGASVHFADEMTRRSPQTLREFLLAEKITIGFVPTVLAEQLLHAEWPADTALRIFLTGADTLHRRPAAGLPFVVVNNYGPTECTVVTTSGIVSAESSGERPSIGRAISNAEVFILDENLHSVPEGEPGELCISGDLVGRGYRNNPELTAAKFVHYPDKNVRIYRTGDRAQRLESGEIAFLGRLDDQVKIRGYRIELGEIIVRLDRYPGIDASAVIAADGDAGPSLVAYIVPSRGAKLNSSDLREFLAVKLPEYMIPAKFVALDELPMTANGKLDKSALPAPSAENQVSAPQSAATTADAGIQSQIGAMVAGLLGQPSVGPEENFFMIGGHSMLGVQLVARIRDLFKVKLTLRQLFGAPTITALAAEVAKLIDAGK